MANSPLVAPNLDEAMKVIESTLFRPTFEGLTSSLAVEFEGKQYSVSIVRPADYAKNRTKEQAEGSMKLILIADIIEAVNEDLNDFLKGHFDGE